MESNRCKLLCMGCLSVGKTLKQITDTKCLQFYKNTLKEMDVELSSMVLNVCIECMEQMMCCIRFKDQVKDTYRALRNHPEGVTNQHGCDGDLRTPSHTATSVSTKKELKTEYDDMDLETDVINMDASSFTRKPSDDDMFKEEVMVKEDSWNTDLETDVINMEGSSFTRNPSVGDVRNEQVMVKEYSRNTGKDKLYNTDNGSPMGASIGKSLSNKKKGEKRPGRKAKKRHKENLTITGLETDVINMDGSSYTRKPLVGDVFKEEIMVKEDSWDTGIDNHFDTDNLADDRSIDSDMDVPISKLKKDKSKNKTKKNKKKTKCKNQYLNSILTVELTVEEMNKEREVERQKESYVNAPYKCPLCVLGFSYESSYNAHVNAKHLKSLGEYSCPVCETVSAHVDAFTAHYKRHMRRYECGICGKRTSDLKSMHQHYFSVHHIALKVYRCNLCGKVSNSIDAHKYHRDTHKSRVKCDQCEKTFSHRAGLMNHRLAFHGDRKEFPCSVCAQLFRWKASLKRHMVKHHKNGQPIAAAKCASCDITFTSISSYQRHLKNSLKHVSQNDLRYICDDCGRRFADKTKLRDHIEEKHLHKTYQCSICHKASRNRVGLEQHVRNVHRGRAHNMMCHHCGKSFPTRVQLECHIRTHTGERPFICEFCPTTFSQQSNLYKHNRQVHMNIKTKRSTKKELKDDKTEPSNTVAQAVAIQSLPVGIIQIHYPPHTGY